MKQNLVIKIGGAILGNEQSLNSLLGVLATLREHVHIVLVHGGGDTVQALLEKLKINSQKIDGIRVTPKEQIPYVTGALAGTVNSQICAAAIRYHVNPVGLTLLDGEMTCAKPMGEPFGAVGTVSPGKPDLLNVLCQSGFLPVISSIACTDSGELLNINADDAAAVIAQLLEADLVLLSDVAGVLDANKQLIPELDANQIEYYCQEKVIQGGMVVKVKSALETAIATQKSVYITSWKTPESLLAFTQVGLSKESDLQKSGCGTRIYDQSSKIAFQETNLHANQKQQQIQNTPSQKGEK